ncbi:MAG: glucosaminidase domain-containing protein [Erysipelotrichaceae bacterium]|nr:glucosaminidase domain-containing protein [Erysipelotrichaceae bacterium]
MKLLRYFLVAVLAISLLPVSLKAEGEVYKAYDQNSSLEEEFSSYEEAERFYRENIDNYDNLILKEDDRIIRMEYGIVSFNTDSACSIITEYHSTVRGVNDYLNGCYGIDAVYNYTSDDGKRVYFAYAGDEAYASIDEVSLIPLNEVNTKISSYTIRDGKMYHDIMSQLDYDFYSYSLALDFMPEFMDENKTYYSHDGHFFYDDYSLMCDDLRNDNHDNAVNEEAYYNYYQYLSHRSLSEYSAKEVEEYFYDNLGYDKKLSHYTDFNNDGAADEVNRSQLSGEIGNFFVYQDIYGANALLLLASAVNESSYGKSFNSFISNNLYTASAYESESEKEVSRYERIEDSIYAHAKYFISSRYSNHLRSDYTGTFLGNKVAGINVNYAIDPYYGEKTAAACFELDSALSLKDYNAHALGIIKDNKRVNFYRDETLENRRFYLKDIVELSFVILDENEEAYKIQVDPSFDSEYRYDFYDSCAWVPKDEFYLIINEDKIREYDLHEYYYDFNGGRFHDYSELEINSKDERPLIIPGKDGYEFTGYDEEGVAQYKAITNVDLIRDFSRVVEKGNYLDLSEAVLKVYYDDNSFKQLPLSSDMLRYYDPDEEGIQNIKIVYNGIGIDKDAEFSEELSKIRNMITEAVENNDYVTVKANMGKIDYPFSFAEIRSLDYELKNLNQRNYVIKDRTEKYNLSISGLDLSLADKTSLSLFGDTYYVVVNKINPKDEEKIYSIAKAYGFENVEGLDLSFRFNYQNIELSGPAIVQIDIEDKKNNLVYTVYHLNDQGDVIKCKTTQSENYIQFMIRESGPYLVLSLPSANEYDIKDNTEDLSYENMGFDNHKMNFELMGIMVLTLIGIIGVTVYYIISDKRERMWKDFRRSLRTAGSVQEEKPKN